jgi:glycosyltransferase involved in cell wall biosynthesis
MWAFTGGCHYSGDCEGYTKSCGSCPQLQSKTNWDLSRWVWQRKRKAWNNLNLTIVTPSKWLAECAKASSLFQGLRIEVIPNGVDIQKYKPINQAQARDILGLPIDKNLILFVSASAISDSRKGFQFLQPALQQLRHNLQLKDQTELVIVGSSPPIDPPNLGFKAHYLGRLNDDISLALLYAAADVFVAPSLEDNLPNTVIESLACGTPCVSFKIGGMPDMIDHRQNGYLAQPFEIKDLANGIAWVLMDSERHKALREQSRKRVEKEFSTKQQVEQYVGLYRQLINKM